MKCKVRLPAERRLKRGGRQSLQEGDIKLWGVEK
jgi:hypothetical protein